MFDDNEGIKEQSLGTQPESRFVQAQWPDHLPRIMTRALKAEYVLLVV